MSKKNTVDTLALDIDIKREALEAEKLGLMRQVDPDATLDDDMVNELQYIAMVQVMHADGSSKNDVALAVITASGDYGLFDKVLKKSGIKFGGSGKFGWRQASVAAFLDKPGLTKAEYIEAIKDHVNDTGHYSGHFYEMLKALANGVEMK